MPTASSTPPLDSRQLLTVVALARTRSFTEAAHQLNLTQSAVSHSLKALERQLGHTIFERKGRWIQPTQAGDLLLREAMEILNRMQRIRDRLDNLENWGASRLRVSASPSLCHLLLPPVLREYRQSFPRSSILIRPHRGPQSLDLLRQSEVDLILTETPSQATDDFKSIDWFTDELVAVLPPFHPLAERTRLRAVDFENSNIHLLGNDSQCDTLIRNYFNSHGLRSLEYLEVGSVETAREMVKLGQGLALLPHWVVESDVELGALVTRPLDDHKLERQWRIYWMGRKLNLQEETFIGLCMEARETILENRVLTY